MTEDSKTVGDVGDFVEDAAARFEAAGLSYGHGTSNAFDDAAFLVLETLKLPVDDLESAWNLPVNQQQARALETNIRARIETRKPSSYLVNRAYIQGISFYVDERVIVPRSFIGEILCQEEGFSRIGDYEDIKSAVDICTGSGCLAILAAHLFPNACIDAVDLSRDAVAVAGKNVNESGLKDRITLFEGDLFSPLAGRTYDLIITNPPYVDENAMNQLPPEYQSEPSMTLAGGRDGMDLVRKILMKAADFLAPGGGLLCEIGQGKEIMEAEYDLPFLWLDTEESEGEVFWLTREQLIGK